MLVASHESFPLALHEATIATLAAEMSRALKACPMYRLYAVLTRSRWPCGSSSPRPTNQPSTEVAASSRSVAASAYLLVEAKFTGGLQ